MPRKKNALLQTKTSASMTKKPRPPRPQVIKAMPQDWSQCDPSHLDHPALYINRELSWLEFNQRVLDQVYDSDHPLLERVKFFAIVGNNLDEFFMVRLSTILKKLSNGIEDVSADGLTTQQQFWLIRERAQKMMEDQKNCWTQTLHPLLEENGIHFLDITAYTPEISAYLTQYFKREIYPTLTPLAFDPGHPFPHISNLSMNFAVVVQHNDQEKFARVKIPSMLSRFIQLPAQLCAKPGHSFVFLEDVIRANMQDLFPETEIKEIDLFRVIRDTDLVIQEDEADDLLETVDKSLRQVRYGAVSLLRIEKDMPQRIVEILAENFQAIEGVIHPTDSRMGFTDWMSLIKLPLPQHKDPSFVPNELFDLRELDIVFEQIKYRDLLVHHPYESFSAVELFLRAAVNDPQVIAIKMTLYRMGQNSPIIELLGQAAEAGKQVAVLVELKARFDEKNNIVWAKRLESQGVHVVYGLLKLKTHSKICLIVRKEADGIHRYVHLGTGNYNRATAKIYTDLSIFTSNDSIGEDVSQVFNFLTGYSSRKTYKKLLVAPYALRQGITNLIQREIEHAKAGRPAQLIFKVNALADVQMIKELYRASQAGVKIELIVRGVCCLRPGVPGVSENIQVRSIVGRFLEHSRLYYFANGGQDEIYFGSADLMERNLDRRVEVIAPVLDAKIRQHLKEVLGTMLKDNERASLLQVDGHYTKLAPAEGEESLNSQDYFLHWYTSAH